METAVRQWLQAGDEAAARWLVKELYPMVTTIIRRRLFHSGHEEDVAQEVFLKIFARLDRYDVRLPLENWVARITLNTCLDHLRSRHRRPELRWADLPEEEAGFMEKMLADGNACDPADSAAACELYEKLLECLDPRDRMVVQMLQIEQRSVAEIRALTGWSTALIKVRAFRARQKLKQRLAHLEKTKR